MRERERKRGWTRESERERMKKRKEVTSVDFVICGIFEIPGKILKENLVSGEVF